MSVLSDQTGQASRTLSRRDFKIALGTAAGFGILGYLLERPGKPPDPVVSTPDSSRPMLRQGLVIKGPAPDGMTSIRVPDGSLCVVNATGAEVVRRLDGAHTIDQIAHAVSRGAGVTSDPSLAAKVACFVAQLGAAGFLEKPFYAQIVDRMDA